MQFNPLGEVAGAEFDLVVEVQVVVLSAAEDRKEEIHETVGKDPLRFDMDKVDDVTAGAASEFLQTIHKGQCKKRRLEEVAS